MEDLDGKVAVITGSASGIGRALAERFATERMRLVLADVEADALEIAGKELAEGGAEVLVVPTDVSDAASVDDLARRAHERFGPVQVVCNNAGVAGHASASWNTPTAEWEWVVGVNLWGVINGIRSFVPALVEADEGHVVNTASTAGLAPIPFMAPYTTTKHAIVGASEALFHELALGGSNVHVSVLCPGFLKTRLGEADRNWPAHLEMPERSEDPAARFVEDFVVNGVADGALPSVLADRVVDAITTERFMVLTDEDQVAAAMTSRAGTMEGRDPVLPFG
jgi:NAD(P)-dependent dehydrogenase (short-subunit alcohol dehydrogenase family)